MLTGLELILKRMESHPEEFAGVNGGCSKEWYSVISPVIDHLTDEEKKALTQGMKQAYRDHFNGQVLKKVAGERLDEEKTLHVHEDYYGGPSLFERLNGTTSRDIARAMMDNRVVNRVINKDMITVNGNYALQESQSAKSATMPSAFGAVPTWETSK